MIPVRVNFFISLILFTCCCSRSIAQTATNNPADTNAIKAERDAAIGQVEKIVNQMVPAYRRAPGMQVGKFSPGWFHEGAMKPDYNTVDVRATRETAEYDKSEYCTSDLNPGLVWKSRDLEFNSMTKYFYTNRTFPKKRLTEAEMVEINRLYRIIGKCEQQLFPAPKPAEDSEAGSDSSSAPQKRGRLLNPYIGAPVLLLLALLLIFMYKRRS
jgi:hypothetical protein